MGVKVGDAGMKAFNTKRAEFHGAWNYRLALWYMLFLIHRPLLTALSGVR